MLLHPQMAGRMCMACAQSLATAAASVANSSSTVEKFDKYVAKGDSCWEWGGYRHGNGYGAIWHEGKQVLVHRWSYEHFVGPIPDGLTIDHLCRNRACVNPAHMEPVTSRENTRRAMRTHCINGHEFTPENTYTPNDGKRYCRECRRQRNRTHRKKISNA